MAAKPEEFAEFLRVSDADRSDPKLPAPIRDAEKTRRTIAAGEVHLLKAGPKTIGAFTLTQTPTFDASQSGLRPLERPMYLSRLSLDPAARVREPLLGAHCVRHAIDIATSLGADGIRADVNPDMTDTLRLMTLMGFHERGRSHSESGVRHLPLQHVFA